MVSDKPTREFGRRGPIVVQPAAPAKRSGHVALLLMGTFAVGGGAYALMPRANCQPSMATPSASQTAADCAAPGSSSGGHGGSAGGSRPRSAFFSGDPSSSHSSGTSSESDSGGVTRGGFGSFARAFSVHFSGGG